MTRSIRGAFALLAATFLMVAGMPAVALAGVANCSNGTLEFGEGCDDGDLDNGDGCNSACFIENDFSCNGDKNGLVGDASCESGICDETEGGNGVCEPANECGNSALESGEGCDDGNLVADDGCDSTCLVENGSPCNLGDNAGAFGDASCASGNCDESVEPTPLCAAPPPTTSSTTTTTSSTTTTSTTSSTSSTMQVQGACCYNGGCQTVDFDYCSIELLGSYKGDDTSCDTAGICSNCGNGCIEFGETCDDADTENGDGCDEKCQEESCFICFASPQISRTVCFGTPGPSQCVPDQKCSICGNGEVESGEQCDPGKGIDPCCDSQTCQFKSAGSSCDDGLFCTGAEQCDGSGNCTDAPNETCTHLTTSCKTGICDSKADECVAINVADGTPCEAGGECLVGGGSCQSGVCTGAATTLSPTCRWVVLGGSPAGAVRVRLGTGSTVDADMCGDTARFGGTSTHSLVGIADSGESIRFHGAPVIDGDIVTGKGTVKANNYTDIPGTLVKFVDTNLIVPKLPSGFVNTKGVHPLVTVCNDDQTLLASADSVLDNMASTGTEDGLKVGIGDTYEIDVTGDGVAVIDMASLKLSRRSTLSLKGTASDVIMLRINEGRLKLSFGANVVLDGLVPQNVLFYADGEKCRVAPGSVGAGTMYCPNAGRFVVGTGVEWSGTFMGARRELRVRFNAHLTHVPFTGF